VTVNTPAGNSPASEAVAVCDNQWREWTPTSAPVRIGASAGVLTAPSGNRFIVMVSGRLSVNTLNSMPAAGVRTQLLPAPSCQNPTPTWTAAVNTGPVAPPSRWGAAYAVFNNALYIVGGTTNGGSCTRSMRRMTLTNDTTANWTAVATLPDTDTAQSGTQGLCQGSLQVVRDTNGKAWLVLTGGTTTPVPQTNCLGGDSPSLRTYVLDPLAATPTWVVHTAVAAVDNDGAAAIFRFGSTGASNTAGTSALVVGGSSSTSTPGGSVTTAATVSISTTGVPTFTSSGGAALPSGIYRAAATFADGFVYLVGGSTALSGATCNATNRGQLPSSTQLLRIPESFTGPWTTLANLPTPRAEHVVVAVESTGGTEDKLYVIGGHNSTTGQTAVLEYTP
jgi:hypothetical protein